MTGRYQAIGGRVIYRDSKGARVVHSAVTVNGRDVERFHAAARLAQQQRRLAQADAADPTRVER